MTKTKMKWSNDEKDYIIQRVTKDKIHPRDLVIEFERAFKKKRSFDSIRSVLWSEQVDYSHLLTNAQKIEMIKKAQTSQVAQYTEAQMATELSKIGYKVEKLSPDKMDRKFKVDPKLFEGDSYKFAVISCSQIGSKFQQLTYLTNFYKYVEDKKIKVVLHCGDLVDGVKVYKGQEYELFLHGAQAQKDYVVEYYPKIEGGVTYVIAGNHDYSFMKEAGEDILESISQKRTDIKYLGAYGAYPQIGHLNIYIAHGKGGTAYARSYRLQKNIEQFAPAAKPDFYFLGHFHVTDSLYQYRNVVAFMMPCFQSQTPHLRQLGLYPEIGGFIFDITVNDTYRKTGLAKMNFEWIPFYVPIDRDY